MCIARLSCLSPPRLSRCRTVWPLDAGTGATPARRAKQASERSRPRCDQATISCAATIGPTPGSSSSCGCERAHVAEQVAFELVSFECCSFDAAREAAQHELCRDLVDACWLLRRRRQQRSSSLPVASPRSSSRSRSGAVTITPRSCVSASRRTSTALRRATSSSRSASRRSPDARQRERVAGERCARCPGRVERVVFAA